MANIMIGGMGQLGWTPAAQLATQNLQGAAGTYASMDKKRNETQNTVGNTTKTGVQQSHAKQTQTTEQEEDQTGQILGGVLGTVAGAFTGGLGTALGGALTGALTKKK